MAGEQRRTRRRGRGLRYAAAALATVLGVIVAPAGLDATGAAFTATTVNPANSLAADRLAPPSALQAVPTCVPAPAVAFTGSTTGTGVDTLTLTVPPGTVPGELLLAQVAHAGTGSTPTAPGWTLIREESNGSAVTSALYRKVVADETSVVFTYSTGGGVSLIGAVAAYSGVRAGDPVDVYGASQGMGTLATTPPVTPRTAGTLLVHVLAKRLEVLPAPGDTAPRWSRQIGTTGSGSGITGGDEQYAGTGTTTSRSSSGTTGGAWIAQTVVLQRERGTPSADLTWTASPSAWATGYKLERSGGTPGKTTRSLDMAGPTSTTDGPLGNGTTYSYRLWAYRGNWTSADATATLTPSC